MTEFRPVPQRPLPEGLEILYELALDLRWSEHHAANRLWEKLDPEAWERTRNRYMILENVSWECMVEVAQDKGLMKDLQSMLELRKLIEEESWFDKNYSLEGPKTIAFFSMEFGLSEALPIYSGGLGILAGDFLKSASDLGIPMVGMGLLYQQGYFRQVLGIDGTQIEAFPYNDPMSLPVTPELREDGSWLRSRIQLPGRELILRVWRAKVGGIDLFLLDSNDPLNQPWDRAITSTLYPVGQEKRLLQELVLGFGGWKALQEMGIEPEICHLNEGHAAFVVLARAYYFMRKTSLPFPAAFWATRAGNIFTTHTPVAAGFDRFDASLIRQYAQYYAEIIGLTLEEVRALGHMEDETSLINAALAMRGCILANGVSELHGSVSRSIFQALFPRWPLAEVPVGHVTNGVHIPTWSSPAAREMWTRCTENPWWWNKTDGESFSSIENLNDGKLWEYRKQARKDLVEYIRRRLVRQLKEHNESPEIVANAEHILDENALTLGLARRFATYKRPALLLHDEKRLERMLFDRRRPVQLILAGKAHPNDVEGKELVQRMANFASQKSMISHVVFLEDYDIVLAQQLLSGIDVWINVPMRPMEASGTSGMKHLANGGLNLSELDGWWSEAYTPEVGWALGDGREHNDADWDAREAAQLYDLLEKEIIPEFYQRDTSGIPRAWTRRIKASMARLTPQYSSHRMVREYLEKAYIPASRAYRRRSSEGEKLSIALEAWRERLERGWDSMRFGGLKVNREGELWRFEIEVFFGKIDPQDVAVELYADPQSDEEPTRVAMSAQSEAPGAGRGHLYSARASSSRPAEHFTPRIIPYHPDAFIPMEESHILWYR
jgi:starch phosphorylase